jgi:hypothetical protein
MRHRVSLTTALVWLIAGCTIDHAGYTTTTGDGGTSVTETSQATTTTAPTEPATTATPPVTTTIPQPDFMWARVPHDASVFGDSSYSQGMHDVTVGGPGLVAVGSYEFEAAYGYPDEDAAVWTSDDGLTWTRVPDDETVFGGHPPTAPESSLCPQSMYGVVSGGPGLVAVGMEAWSVGMEANAAVWTSVDGLVWKRVPHDEAVFGGPDNQVMQAVAAGGPGLVAVGYDESGGDRDAAVWTSVDGLIWTRIPHDEAIFGGSGAQWLAGVAAGGPGMVAVGYDASAQGGAVWTSLDGLTWTRVPHDPSVFGGLVLESVAAVGSGLVAVGSDSSGGEPDAAVITSPDGLVWQQVAPDESVFGGPGWQEMHGVTAVGSAIVAVGHDRSGGDWDAAVWVSADALTWIRSRSYPWDLDGGHDQGMYNVVAAGPGAIAVGYADGQGIYLETNAAVWVGTPGG